MMREDETIEETRVRLHWVYCLDGPIAAALFLDLIDVLFDVPLYTQRKFQSSVLSWCMTLMVTGAYILANSYFLDVMRRRSLVGVRLVIVYQTVFAVGLLNMLVAVRLQWLLNWVWEGSLLTHSLRVCVRVCAGRGAQQERRQDRRGLHLPDMVGAHLVVDPSRDDHVHARRRVRLLTIMEHLSRGAGDDDSRELQ